MVEVLFDQETPVKDRAALIRHAGRLKRAEILSSKNRIYVNRRAARTLGFDWHARLPESEFWFKLALDQLDQAGHSIDCADTEERHAAVSGPPVHQDFEPVHAPMSQTNPIVIERL